MRRRTWYFRGLGLACLVLGLTVAVVGVLAGGGAFPYNANPFLSYKETALIEAGQYYAEIGAPVTLDEWKTAYFPTTGGSRRASANYYNAGDLGFGREMHCYEEYNFTACYVANHGLGAGAPAEISVQDAVANTRLLPTVAMVYSYTLNYQPNDVMFYAYDTSGNLIQRRRLDRLARPHHGGAQPGELRGPRAHGLWQFVVHLRRAQHRRRQHRLGRRRMRDV